MAEAAQSIPDSTPRFEGLVPGSIEEKLLAATGLGEPEEETSPPVETAPEEQAPEQPTDETESPEDHPAPVDAESEPAPEEDEEVFVLDGEELTPQELKARTLRFADYTRKTQAVAEQRKALEADAAGMTALRTRYDQGLEAVQTLLTEQRAGISDADLAQLRTSNPAEYAAQLADRQQKQALVEKVTTERQRVQEEHLVEQRQQIQAFNQTEAQRFRDAIPELRDDTKFQAVDRQMAQYALEAGFTAEQLDSTSVPMQHQLLVFMYKAMAYDALQGKKPGIVKRVRKSKTLKPGATASEKAPVSRSAEALKRLEDVGGVPNAHAALLGLLEEGKI